MRQYQELYVVAPGETVSGIFVKLYGIKPADFKKHADAIHANNPHVANLDRIRPGMLLDVSMGPSQCRNTDRAGDLLAAERIYAAIPTGGRAVLQDAPQVAGGLLRVAGDVATNIGDSAAYTFGQLVSGYAVASEEYGRKLASAFAKGKTGTLAYELKNVVVDKRPVQEALDKIPRFLQRVFMEEARKINTPARWVGARIAREVRQLIRLAPVSVEGYNPFATVLAKYAHLLKYAKHAGTAFSVAIPTGVAAWDSYKAYGTPEFGRTAVSGTGGVLAGLGGSALGYAACNVIFGAPSAGTSLFWCAIGAGAGLGYAGSKLGGEVFGGTYDVITKPSGVSPSEDWSLGCPTFGGLIYSERCPVPVL